MLGAQIEMSPADKVITQPDHVRWLVVGKQMVRAAAEPTQDKVKPVAKPQQFHLVVARVDWGVPALRGTRRFARSSIFDHVHFVMTPDLHSTICDMV